MHFGITHFRTLSCCRRLALAAVAVGLAAGAAGPLVHFPADGGLEVRAASGETLQAVCGAAAELGYVDGKRGKGVYIPQRQTVAIPIAGLNAQEGTLSFWFRPDWSPNTFTPFTVFDLQAEPAYAMKFRRGFTSPDYCYLICAAGAVSFPSHNLFTARTWRHYALRWSASRGKIEFVVDGDAVGRSRPFACDVAAPVKAQLLLRGDCRAAFDDVKVYDRFLETVELAPEAGLSGIGPVLQRQAPPPGALSGEAPSGALSYVDPATGREIVVPAHAGGDAGAPAVYNPARMPELPETPHVKWAKPLPGGPIRVLFVMENGFYNERSPLREAIELWQRVDMDCDVVEGPAPAVLTKDYDVIAVTHQGFKGVPRGWTHIDETLRTWILERVNAGKSGLILAYPLRLDGKIQAVFDVERRVASHVLLRGFPTAAMHRVDTTYEHRYEKVFELEDGWYEDPYNLGQNVVEVFRDDTVRAVRLNYRSAPWHNTMAFTPDTALNAAATDVHNEHWLALAARALLFAAGRLPAARIASADVSGSQWRAAIEAAPAGATLQWCAQDAWGRLYCQGEGVVPDDGAVSIEGVDLPPRTFVDFRLRSASGQALDWHCAATPPPSGPRVAAIRLGKELYEPGDTVRGVVELTAERPGPRELEMYLSDHEARRLVRQVIPVQLGDADGASTRASFRLTIPLSARSLLLRVDALLRENGRVVDTRSVGCPVPHKAFDGFYAGMSGGSPNRSVDRRRRRWFRDEFGVDYFLHSGNHTHANLASQNLLQIEYTTHLGYPRDEKSFSKWMEPWEDFFPKRLRCDARNVMPYRPIFYSLGEEHYMLMGSTANPEANARFRKHLQAKYGKLETLNDAWGAEFASWDQVSMLSPEIVDMLKIQFSSPRFENRRFMEKLFADKHAYLATWFRRIDPHASVGIHVGWDLWMGRGYDYWLLSRGMEAMLGYGGVQNQYIRSFFHRHYGCWFHYKMGSTHEARWHPWYMLMSGARGFCWYTISPQIWGATTADMHLSSDFAACKDEFRDAGDLGDLLVRARYLDDQVAIHYSQDSFQAGVAGLGLSNLSWLHTAAVNLLFDGGVPFRFVSYEQVANGELQRRRFPVLILPHSISLSPVEAEAIRAYVQEGGLVWADVLPGTHSHFGKRLESSQLADLFADLTEAPAPGGLTVSTGAFGRGRVILGSVGNYNYDRNVGAHEPAQGLLDMIVTAGGIQRAARVLERGSDRTANGVWTAGYASGDQHYVVATKDWQLADRTPAAVRIALPRQGHVYEMRSGSYLGLTSSVETELAPTTGKAFAVLPYEVGGLTAKSAGRADRGRDLVLEVRLDTRGQVGRGDIHLLRVRVTAPNGEEVMSLRSSHVVRAGAGRIRLPLAWDDPSGQWTVQVRDSTTGKEAELQFRLP